MAFVVPLVIVRRVIDQDVRLHHFVALAAWLLFLASVYDEVVIERAL